MRAADADRERAIEAIRVHAGEGRLTLDELDERVGAATAARTLGDLRDLLADLPQVPVPFDERAARARAATEFRDHVRSYLAVNVLLIVIWALTGMGAAWFIWPLLGWGIAVVAQGAPLLLAQRPRGDRRLIGA